MLCKLRPCGQRDVGSSQKTFLAFSRTSKRRHWSKLSTKELFFFFFWPYSEKNFACRRISIWAAANNHDWVNQSEHAKYIIRGWEFDNVHYYMASSASRQDGPNLALWLATRAAKMERYCRLGIARFVPAITFSPSPSRCTKVFPFAKHFPW